MNLAYALFPNDCVISESVVMPKCGRRAKPKIISRVTGNSSMWIMHSTTLSKLLLILRYYLIHVAAASLEHWRLYLGEARLSIRHCLVISLITVLPSFFLLSPLVTIQYFLSELETF